MFSLLHDWQCSRQALILSYILVSMNVFLACQNGREVRGMQCHDLHAARMLATDSRLNPATFTSPKKNHPNPDGLAAA